MRVGRVDVEDVEELGQTLAQLEELLALCLGHVQHENQFMHPAIEAAQPLAARVTATDHDEHQRSIVALRAAAHMLGIAPPEGRPVLASSLYRELALFVSDKLHHMHVEESQLNAVLWAHYSDAELLQLHTRLLASIGPREHLQVARWMVLVLNPLERAAMLGDIERQSPPEAFRGLLAGVGLQLDDSAWNKLAHRVGVVGQSELAQHA